MSGWGRVLLDFDGVLCDSREPAIEVAEQLRKTAPYSSLPSPAAEGDFGRLYRGELRTALERFGLTAEESRAFFDAHAAGMRERADDLSLFDGVAEGLARLPATDYAIITSAYSATVASVFAKAGVELAPESVMGHEVRATKTEKIQRALAAHGIGADQAVYVGDLESDILYCRSVPIRCIAATYGYHPRGILEGAVPAQLVDTPAELFSMLASGLGVHAEASASEPP